MAVRTKQEILELVKARIGEDESDEAIAFIEDITDTIADFESKAGEDWRAKYEENDREWRQRYRDRFFNPDPQPDGGIDKLILEPEEDEDKPKTYEDLFETK